VCEVASHAHVQLKISIALALSNVMYRLRSKLAAFRWSHCAAVLHVDRA
jgi:hypothetical protein